MTSHDVASTLHQSLDCGTKSVNPSGCPECNKCNVVGRRPTATNNLKVWCGANGREDLLEEWAHPDTAPEGFLQGSAAKVPWECGKCSWQWDAVLYSRTRSVNPSGCPKCHPWKGQGGRTARESAVASCAQDYKSVHR